MVKSSVNMKLLPMKGHYFFFNAGTAPVVPFMTTYARQLGFSSSVVGTMYAILPITGLLAKPLFGAIADRFRLQKLLFILFQAITAIAFFCILFIPTTDVQTKLRLNCGFGGETFLDVCFANGTIKDEFEIAKLSSNVENINMSCQLKCPLPNLTMWDTICDSWHATQYCGGHHYKDEILEFTATIPLDKTLPLKNCLYFKVSSVQFSDGSKKIASCPFGQHITVACEAKCDSLLAYEQFTIPKHSDSQVTNQYQFWIFFFLLCASWVGMAVVVSVGDAICFEMLGDEPSKYGQQRLFGSLGWGIFSIMTGILVDYFSKGDLTKNYTPAFCLMLILLIIDILTSLQIKHKQSKMTINILSDVGRLLTDGKILIFVFWCIAVGLSTGLIWQFLFWHLEDLAKHTASFDTQSHIKTLEGVVMGIQCFGGEIPFLFLSGSILRKIGHINAMHLVLLGFGTRFILYSLLSNPWLCLPIEFLHGITFGIFYPTMTSYASIVAPSGAEATVQGLVGAIFEGIGVSLGSLIGGVIYDRLGGALTFRWFGIASFILFIIHVAIQRYVNGRTKYNIPDTDFQSSARYAAPGDAVHIIED